MPMSDFGSGRVLAAPDWRWPDTSRATSGRTWVRQRDVSPSPGWARFHYLGSPDREQKIAFLRNLDAFSVPTVYVEPKGLFLLEAMACGVPVVQPNHGAFPEILSKTAGGLLVDPGSADSLAEGLFTLWTNAELRAQLGQQGFDGVRRHYSIASSADRMLEVYERWRC